MMINMLLLSRVASIFTDNTMVTLLSVYVRRLKCYDGSEIFFDRGKKESYCRTPFDFDNKLHTVI